MKIPVIFVNGSLGVICDADLDEMLAKKLIAAFQRSSGLAIVGRDEVRSNRGNGNGSWKDRKKNQRPREEVIFLPPRTKFQPSFAYEIMEKRIETALPKEVPIAANQR
ncbi:MAG: GSU3473 family protein [Oryzomonas sp.]|jgi:hypothetical protein